ncbi:NucA/NucB deoxyribonuclease domain-containing protein [Actinomadura coerulea]|uniref:NucA/NucB deoxyribonuclease domain-containing protein n=1 Tax=Actinomadura coerulea TaxID=46159 RepID=UPI003F4E2FAE
MPGTGRAAQPHGAAPRKQPGQAGQEPARSLRRARHRAAPGRQVLRGVPFASAKEGGNTLPRFYRGWAVVRSDQQNCQAGFITGLYKQNRVIDNDPFYVQV